MYNLFKYIQNKKKFSIGDVVDVPEFMLYNAVIINKSYSPHNNVKEIYYAIMCEDGEFDGVKVTGLTAKQLKKH